jgi:phosphate:Na+ symporter
LLILLNFLASVALLIWGTHIVRTGILRVYGADLRRVLSKHVSNRFSAFLAGLGVTSLLQSSSATALITSSFVSQNLIALAAALAIMLGADVGTALMAQLFSLNLSWLSPLLIFFGVVFFLPRRNSKAAARARGDRPRPHHPRAADGDPGDAAHHAGAGRARDLLDALGDPVLDMLIGAAFTIVSFSSLAVVLLTATLAATNVVSIQVALCLVLGAKPR